MSDRTVVLDSWALMALFENQPSADSVEAAIVDAMRSDAALILSVVNAGELWYSTARGHCAADADRIIDEIGVLRIEIVEADWEITRQAATYKAKAKIAYADCFAAALAKLRKAPLVTGDPEFKALEKEIRIHWV